MLTAMTVSYANNESSSMDLFKTFLLVVLHKQIEAVLKRHYGEMDVELWEYECEFYQFGQSK